MGDSSDTAWVPAGTESSRECEKAAGWFPEGQEPSIYHWRDRLDQRVGAKWDSFSWLTVRALLESVNDVFAKAGPTVVRRRRARWVAAQRAAGVERPDPEMQAGRGSFSADFVIDWTRPHRERGRSRFLLLGDPGEADASQYAVIDPLLAAHAGTAPGQSGGPASNFMVIVSDVIYPAGDINEYVNAFYRPYEQYDAPIYAIPGNHDWYDGLNGFMYHFCAAEPIQKPSYRTWGYGPGELAAQLLWRGAARPDREALAAWISKRLKAQRGNVKLEFDDRRPCGAPQIDDTYPEPPPLRRAVQPTPYFAIDTGPLLVVAIDTGVRGDIDPEQGDWLRRVSMAPKPKILLTGKPIYVNNDYEPSEIAWADAAPEAQRNIDGKKRPLTVDDIVREPANCYVAAIGGDIHNYQRYPVRLTNGRIIEYIVSGGGGAYLSATHMIPTVKPTTAQDLPPEVDGFDEASFRCYPLRGDSLALFTRRVGPVLFNVMLSAFALIVAAYLVLWPIVPLGDRQTPVVWASLGSAALTLMVVIGFILRDTVIKVLPDGFRMAILACGAAAIGLGVTATLVGVASAPVSEAVGITLGLPFLIIAVVILAYDLRGSAPRFSKSLVLIAPLIALWEIFAPRDLSDWAAVPVYLIGPFFFLVLVVWFLEWAKGRFGNRFYETYRLVLPIAWLALTARLLLDHAGGTLGDMLASDAWLTWIVVALLGTAFVVARVIPLSRSGRRRVHTPDPHRTGETAGAIVGISVLALALLALDAAGDGWPAKVTATAVFTILGWASILVLLGAVIGLRMTPRALYHLRTGEIDPAYASMFVSERIGGEDPVRQATVDYNDERKRGMAEVVRRLGKSVSEIADTNEPPFYKSFLDVEVDDRTLTIRCFGVTGYSKQPALEDEVVINLPQAEDPSVSQAEAPGAAPA